ncbi:MAG: hypothetical protein K0B02_02500 [DPANN group archaeon]|nr:hypothetical protein [DPANN group archaeon]
MGISLDCKSKVQLKQTDGYFVPFGSFDVPEILQSPWIMSDVGGQEAYSVGYRSSVFLVEGVDGNSFYKLKGCRPYDGTYFRGTSIFGVLSPEKALNELRVTDVLKTFYESYGVVSPHNPCGYYLYDNPIDSKGLACNVIETNGEMRLTPFLNKFLEIFSYDTDFVDDFILNVVEWLGFNQYSLKHCNIGIVKFEDSIDPANYIFSTIDGGYGLFGVDHTSSELGGYHELSDNYISNLAMESLFLNKCLQKGMSYKDFKLCTIPFSIDDCDMSKIDAVLGRYYNFYDSGCLPKPLDSRIVDAVELNIDVNISDFFDYIKHL